MPILRVRRVHPLWVRWMHWLNFPLLAIMVVSGVFIYWANDVYTPFVPRDWYEVLGLDHRLAYGMALHFFFMWFFALNGLLFVTFLAWTGEWRHLVPRPGHFLSEGKFNPAQRVAYTGVIAMGALSVLTGLAIFKPVQLGWLRTIFFGYSGARFIHFLLAVGFVGFFVIHVTQVARAGWNKFRGMVVGDEVVEDERA